MNIGAQLFFIANFLFPKNRKLICLTSFPDYDDQTRALIAKITKTAPEYKIAVLVDKECIPPSWAQHKNISHYKKYSPMGIYIYMRSKTVFFTHGCFSASKTVPKQTVINVWHGMPIKKIGQYISEEQHIPHSDYTLATSDFFAEKISYAFQMPEEKVIIAGLPRNDILLKGINESLRKKIDNNNSNKIVVWLPTYRGSAIGENNQDGTKDDNIFNLPDLDINELNQRLKSLGIIAVIKPHPMAIKHGNTDTFDGYSNIKVINENWLLDNDTTLYELLAQSDLLITDISSVLIDYLLLEKPIICHFPDINTYKNSRGLIWNYNPSEYGIPVVSTQKNILNELENPTLDKQKLFAFKKLSHDIEINFSSSLLNHLNIK